MEEYQGTQMEKDSEITNKIKTMSKFKLTCYKGVDDLQSEYAFVGSSQGDHSKTNSIQEYKDSKGWLVCIWEGVDLTDQDAIDKEAIRRHEENLNYIDQLVKSGEYKKPYTITIEFEHSKIFDKPGTMPKESPLQSFRLMFIDNSKQTHDNRNNS